MDQMLTGYSCKRSTNRWPLAIFYNMLDIAGLASFIIYDELNPAKQSDKRRSFIIELARQLVIPHMTKRATNPLVWRFAHIRQAMNLFNIKAPESCPSTSDATQQQSYAQVASKRSSCYQCAASSSKKRRKTRYNCSKCNRPIYLNEHSMQLYSCKPNCSS
ncbi:PREDICTED: uncharacterized protein LOC108975620 [Bactrocera latifrons]|uniref:uncharacterized protein LOC108975620 n=1 Tax=Bactrocera latifrons TaxID=174628 RepID=UPI0008DE134E|nr:PREDICTED: uncharacterized protein LOC108975620 [Bactrocera latifrons]